MTTISITLNRILEELDVTPYRLSLTSGIRTNTIYSLVNNESKAINIELLGKLIDSVNLIASEKNIPRTYTISDFLSADKEKNNP